MKLLYSVVLICASFLLFSCETDPEIILPQDFDQALFDRERAAWNASGVKNYYFNIHVGGYGSSAVIRFVVENEIFQGREVIQSGNEIDHIYQNGFTIPAFYDEIEQYVQSSRKKYKGRTDAGEVITVVYNTDHHYPVRISTTEWETEDREPVACDTITWYLDDFERKD
jgi:hypothetical protein